MRVVLIFGQGQGIALKEGKFESSQSLDLSSLNERLNQEPGIEIFPLYGPLTADQQQSTSGGEFPDLSRHFGLELQDPAAAAALANQLNELPMVYEAYLNHEPRPPAKRLTDRSNLT